MDMSFCAADLVGGLREQFLNGRTRTLEFRTQQLEGLQAFIREQESALENALKQDLGKPALEAFAAEIAFIARELRLFRKHLKSWARSERVATPLFAWPGKSRIDWQPLGVVLIIAPWNYPVQLSLAPLIGAIAAGNCVVLKPSELAPATSALLSTHLPLYLDANCIRVVVGGPDETTALLAERFDHIFYTGSGSIAKIVMTAAAKHLTPVTLELGGKCPCLVAADAELEVAARRIAWGKFSNAGQTCVAPDYILVEQSIEETLLDRLQHNVRSFYGEDPRTSPDFGRIVSARHHRRLVDLLPGSGKIVLGGQADIDERYLAPTILRDVPPQAAVMAEEIFGPILPILTVRDMDEAIAFVNRRPRPLALYLFSRDRATQERVLERTCSGGAVINHTVIHEVVSTLPFGGVGASGMGAYHGKASFDTFSHRRSVLIKSNRFDLPIIYPPYSDSKKKWIRRLV